MILVGAGGHAREVYDAAREGGDCPKAFYVEDGFMPPAGPSGLPDGVCGLHVHPLSWLRGNSSDLVVVAVGDPGLRKRLVEAVQGFLGTTERESLMFRAVVHPEAVRSRWSILGVGSQVLAGAVLGNRADVGRHCIVNHGAVLCHDVVLEDYATVGPNATLCGGARVLEGGQVGAGAVVLPGVTVGRWAILGAGGVAVKNIPDGEVWAGNPARSIRVS